MNRLNKTILTLTKITTLTLTLSLSFTSFSAELNAAIDDFSNVTDNSIGLPRQYMNDTVAGGSTKSEQQVLNGVIALKGEITPPRGQPGWSSLILPLGPLGVPQDASNYEGVRLLVKLNSGNLSISANSTEITNFDYHAAPVSVMPDSKFHEVKIPFTSLKRAWSEQTKLNTKTINSLSIVAYSLQKASFNFEVDEVSFY